MNRKKSKGELNNRKNKYITILLSVVIGSVVILSIFISKWKRDNIEKESQSTIADLMPDIFGEGIDNNNEDMTIENYIPYEVSEVVFPDMSTEEKMDTEYPADQIQDFMDQQISHEDCLPEPLVNRLVTDIAIPYDGKDRTITCWGDSMTEGNGTNAATITVDGETKDISGSTFPNVLESLTGIKTYNLGVGGETSQQIAQRQGGLKMVTDRDIELPDIGVSHLKLISADTGLEVNLNDYSGYGLTDDKKLNRVYIGNIMCKLTFNGRSHMAYKKIHHRTSKSGDAPDPSMNNVSSTFIPAGTMVYTLASRERKDDILIIEMGSNGGWDDYNDLVRQYDSMIASANCSYYIIIGDTDDPPYAAGLGEDAWEATLHEAYGDHFLNMRQYLIENGLNDCGLTTSYADMECYYNGQISKKLRADWTHLNAYGYYSKGLAVYQKGVELGYWN